MKTAKFRWSQQGRELRQFIRLRMKIMGVSYASLAKSLKVPEIRIKRWMTNQDLKLEELIQIGEKLHFRLFEKMEFGSPVPENLETYTWAQEEFKTEYPLEALFALKIRYGSSVDDAAAEAGVAQKSIPKVLRKLDELGLITLLPGNKLIVRTVKSSKFLKNGPVMTKLLPAFTDVVLRHFSLKQKALSNPENRKKFQTLLSFEMYLSKAQAESFGTELAQVVAKYRQISVAVKSNKNLEPFAGVVAVDSYDAWKTVYLEREKAARAQESK